MILLWGLSRDPPLGAVHEALLRRGAPVAVLDQRDVLETEIDLAVEPRLGGEIRARGLRVDLAEVTAVYLRLYDARRLPRVVEAAETGRAAPRVDEIEGVLDAWVEETDARVYNRPSAMASNNSKPHQAALIRAHGFSVPATLVTTDALAVRELWERHGEVVYKSISGVRSIVARLGPGDRARLDEVASCPTQFQEYVPGRDHRVHVVGDEVFACEVVSAADDYRYAPRDGLSVEMKACALPAEVADRCRTVAHALALPVAGIDLRRTPEGAWYCFEVNPSPCFTYYEAATGLPIADAIAALLASGA